MKRTVVLGFFGSTLDAGFSQGRWNRWRPSVDVCRHEDLRIDRFELLVEEGLMERAEVVKADIAQVSPETTVVLRPMHIEDPWDFQEVFGTLQDFATRYTFRSEREDYLVNITTGSHVMQICWFLLTESRHVPARLLQASPPRQGRARGEPGEYSIIDLDLARYDQLARRFQVEREEGVAFLKSGIQTRSPAFNRLIERLEQVALRSREPILLTGPTGAGKSKLATQIFELRRARALVEGALVSVNCATIRGDGAMSALFGHVRGAFTGAQKDRHGLLRKADRGVLFLDEIGELGLDEQAMLLRAIEEKTFFPVGADTEQTSDFQLIAGTNRDLWQAVAAGTFREDLLARLDIWTFELPGLAQRREDIEPNLEYELTRCSDRLGRAITMNREARHRFLEFACASSSPWTANFRDLGAAVLRMATLAPSGRIDVATVREEEARLASAWSRGPSAAPADDGLEHVLGEAERASLDPFDRVQLAEVVRICRRSANLSEAGRCLFSVSRTKRTSTNDADRLRKYLARYGLDWEKVR